MTAVETVELGLKLGPVGGGRMVWLEGDCDVEVSGRILVAGVDALELEEVGLVDEEGSEEVVIVVAD